MNTIQMEKTNKNTFALWEIGNAFGSEGIKALINGLNGKACGNTLDLYCMRKKHEHT